ncbi:cytochrome b5 [Colletes latitarsis]|uniref:cytochrome b5 n=1 Tax=Colletes latitarsis TaxID=2605962 RepID=UPI0040362A6A
MSKTFTKNEVAVTGNSKENTLIILHDKVYNVTNFLNEHPGGEEILLDHAGKDGSDDFDDVGHSKDAFDLMGKYLVGELEESEKTKKTPKMGWTSTYTKPPEKKEEQGMSSTLLIAAVVGFLAILYYVYL